MIASLRVRNFRCFEDRSWTFRPTVNIVTGANGTGKTTIVDAIAVLFSGSCRGAESGGREMTDLRRAGSKHGWEVAMEWTTPSGPVRLARREGEGPKSNAQRSIEEALGLRGAQAKAAIYSHELVELMRDGNMPELRERLRELLPETELTISDRLATLLANHRLAVPTSAAAVKNLRELAYERRREAGRIARQQAPEVPAPEGFRGGLEQAEALRDKMFDKLNELKHELASRGEQLRKVELRERQKRRRDEIEAELETVDVAGLSAELAAGEKELAAGSGLTNAHADALRAAATVRGKIEELGRQAVRLDGLKKSCPTCGQRVDPAKVASAREAILAEAAKYQAEQTKAEKAAAAAAVELQRLAETRSSMERLRQRMGLVEKLRDELAAIPSEVEYPEPDPEQLHRLGQRIALGERKLGEIIEYIGALRQLKAASGVVEKARTEQAELDEIVKAAEELLASVSDASALDTICQTLEPFGFVVEIGEAEVAVNGRPCRLLSKSESMLFGLAWQVAVARWSGLGLVVMDEWEALDPSRSQALLGFLARSGVQSLVSVVARDPDKARAAAEKAGFGFVVLEAAQ